MNDIKVLLAGEGRNDLGRFADAPAYRDESRRGVIEVLLQRVRPRGWRVSQGMLWCSIRKYRAGEHRAPEARTVLGLVQRARHDGIGVVAFVRDEDGKAERSKDVSKGIEQAAVAFPDISVIGGMAVPKLEGWVLAMKGQHGTEQMSPAGADKALEKEGIRAKDTTTMVAVVEQTDLTKLPVDARSLRDWMAKAREVLDQKISAAEVEEQDA